MYNAVLHHANLVVLDDDTCSYQYGQNYVVVLPSCRCYCVPLPGTSTLRKKGELAFELEHELPIDAEDLSYAILKVSGETQCAIGVDGQWLRDLLLSNEHLQSSACLAVIPAALMAWEVAKAEGISADVMVLVGPAGCDVIYASNGKLSNWQWVSGDVDCVRSLLVELQADSQCEVRVAIVGEIETACASWLRGQESLQVLDWRGSLWLEGCVEKILGGAAAPPVEFSNGPLNFVDALHPARRSGILFGLSLAVLLGAIAAGLFGRAGQYGKEASQDIAAQEALFRELFPQQQIPVGMMSRIESEFKRLQATRGKSQVPQIGNVLPVMQAFWKAVPVEPDTRFNLSMMHFIPDQLEALQGLARSYDDLEQLRARFIATGFSVPPLSTRQDSSGVSLQWDHVVWQAIDKQVAGAPR